MNTTGTFVVDCWSAATAGLPDAKIASGISGPQVLQQHSPAFDWQRLHPIGRQLSDFRCRTIPIDELSIEGELGRPSGSFSAKSMSTPTRQGLSTCCAVAFIGQPTVVQAIKQINSRRFIAPPGLSSET